MSTKNKPSKYDPLPKLDGDTEYFALTSNDPEFECMVMLWSMLRRQRVRMGLRPNTPEEREQIAEALLCATNGRIQYEAKMSRELSARMTFNPEGYAASIDGIAIELGKTGS